MEPTNGRKTKLIVFAIIIVIAIAVWLWWRGAQPSVPPTTTTSESVSDLQSAAVNVDTGNLDQEFAPINSDVNSL